MSTIASTASAGNPAYGFPAAGGGGAPVARTADAGLTQDAVDLAAAGSIVSTLGGGSYSALTYNAAGLLNSFVQAGAAPATAPAVGGSSAQNSVDQAVVNTLPSSPAAAGIYNSSGMLQGLPSSTTTNWANALKDNPALAASVISDSYNQGIVGTLSATA